MLNNFSSACNYFPLTTNSELPHASTTAAANIRAYTSNSTTTVSAAILGTTTDLYATAFTIISTNATITVNAAASITCTATPNVTGISRTTHRHYSLQPP